MALRCRLLLPLAVALSLFQGCAPVDPPASEPGISRREEKALVAWYYWRLHAPEPSYSDAQLTALLARSADFILDGERGEEQESAVAVALAAVGDKRFSQALSRQTPPVRKAIAQAISDLWKRYGLEYPRTQALLQTRPGA